MKKLKKLLPILLLLLIAWYFLRPSGAVQTPAPAAAEPTQQLTLLPPEDSGAPAAEDTTPTEPAQEEPAEEAVLPEDGSYTTKEDVALYLITYGHLPDNFVTKKEAEKAGWSGGSLEKVLPGKCIGGDRFGNLEGKLPKASGRRWTECDINTLGKKSRGAERLVFSNDGLIYYTDDHYETFELVWGAP